MPRYSAYSGSPRFNRVTVEADSEVKAVAIMIDQLNRKGFTLEEIMVTIEGIAMDPPPNAGMCFSRAECSGLSACPRRIACND